MFSASSLARDLNRERTRSRSQVRNATIGRFITIRPPARHPGSGFREAQERPADSSISLADKGAGSLPRSSGLSFKVLRVLDFGDDDSLNVGPGLFTLAHQVSQVVRDLA